jgi:hypothetical protein
MTPLVLIAMLLTSMGIFGLLSKAHLEQTSPVANNEIQIERLDQQITREQSRITDAEQVISQLDQSVQALINFDRIRGPDGAIAVRESQADQRELLRQTIDTAQTELDGLEDQKLELSQQLRAIELEVGPIKYIAELIYNDGQDRTEEAVRWVIIAFIFVFDPMAILLLMAANYTLVNRKKQDLVTAPLVEEPTLILEEPVNTEEVLNVKEDSNNVSDTTDIPEPTIASDTNTLNINEQSESGAEPIYLERTDDLQETITKADERDIVPLQSAGAIDIITSVQDQPASITEVKKDDIKKVENKEIVTEGITLACDVGGG